MTRSSQVRSSEDSALNITTSQSGALTEAETEVGSQPDLENSAEDTEGEAGNSDSEELQQLRLRVMVRRLMDHSIRETQLEPRISNTLSNNTELNTARGIVI